MYVPGLLLGWIKQDFYIQMYVSEVKYRFEFSNQESSLFNSFRISAQETSIWMISLWL